VFFCERDATNNRKEWRRCAFYRTVRILLILQSRQFVSRCKSCHASHTRHLEKILSLCITGTSDQLTKQVFIVSKLGWNYWRAKIAHFRPCLGLLRVRDSTIEFVRCTLTPLRKKEHHRNKHEKGLRNGKSPDGKCGIPIRRTKSLKEEKGSPPVTLHSIFFHALLPARCRNVPGGISRNDLAAL